MADSNAPTKDDLTKQNVKLKKMQDLAEKAKKDMDKLKALEAKLDKSLGAEPDEAGD